jgi:transposase
MARLRKADLEQMDETYFKSLEPERLVEVAKNLYELAVEQLEALEQNSQNSSRPPSSDNPYQSSPGKGAQEKVEKVAEEKVVMETANTDELSKATDELSKATDELSKAKEANLQPEKGFGQKKAGKQPGSKGKWRNQPLKAEKTIDHVVETCAACNANLDLSHREDKPYMGYHQFELEQQKQGLTIVCQLHHYYGATCLCGHHSQAIPGQGARSELVGRKVQLQLQEYTLVGPMLATFIASLAVRYRLSRVKIQEFLQDWAGIALSVGSIDTAIRAAGLACSPVVADLIEQLQQSERLHLDETTWYESGQLCWLWVAINSTCVVFFIGARTKEQLRQIIGTAFVGWLISDGYGAYRWYEKRQRCLAHLIRKALALTEAVDAEAKQIGQWLLEEMRELIHDIAIAGSEHPEDPGTTRFKAVAQLAQACEHHKLKALAKEILNDWDAVVAFVTHPELPVTNNEAERALRHAVIARRIGFGTRTSEGSNAYTALLSVIETCRLRGINPWTFLAEVISLRRKGFDAPLMPLSTSLAN